MSRRAMEGTCLPALVRMAISLCRAAEQECPRSGRGRPPDYADWKITVLILVAVIKKRKSKSAQYRFLFEHRHFLMSLLKLRHFPARSTYFDRYHRACQLLESAIRLQGVKAIREGVCCADTAVVDQSLVPGRGPQWNRSDRQANRVPKIPGLDLDCRWGFSPHHGWVHGYCFEVVVAASRGSTIFPLIASVHTANASEQATFGPKIDHLPPETRHVLADAGYDNTSFGDRIEFDHEWRRTGRRFLCPQNPRNDKRKRSPHVYRRPSREAPIKRRRQRDEFFKSMRGKRIFAERGRSIERRFD